MDIAKFLPPIKTMSTADFSGLTWKGILAHIGPVSDLTPLQVALLKKTNCAMYLIYMGCAGLCLERTRHVLDQKLTLQLIDSIYCYQFDWRYTVPKSISIRSVDDTNNRQKAIQLSIPFHFFELVERMPTYFLSERPYGDVSYMINLTRHLCGSENAATVDMWIENLIVRLNTIAGSTTKHSPSIYKFPDRETWEAAVRETHGTPLPPEVLDLSIDINVSDLRSMAISHMNSIDPVGNPLLRPVQDLLAAGFSGTPYRYEA